MSKRDRNVIKMVIDYDRCIRVPLGDEQYMRPSVPYRCLYCVRNGDYNGKLVFEGDPIPQCIEHGPCRPSRPGLTDSQQSNRRGTIEAAAAV